MQYVFFIDFDGTITIKDTCAVMVEAFAGEGWQEINDLWEKKMISTEECANRTFQIFNANLEDLKELLDTIEIDKYFKEFVTYCRSKGYPLYVLSDGYDFIIEYIFQKHGISLPYFANKMVYENGFSIACTYFNKSCGICGTCKKSLMGNLAEPESKIVYVGDGTSDLCPASCSDIVFAKGRLFNYCLEKEIPVILINDFSDVLKEIQNLEGH